MYKQCCKQFSCSLAEIEGDNNEIKMIIMVTLTD